MANVVIFLQSFVLTVLVRRDNTPGNQCLVCIMWPTNQQFSNVVAENSKNLNGYGDMELREMDILALLISYYHHQGHIWVFLRSRRDIYLGVCLKNWPSMVFMLHRGGHWFTTLKWRKHHINYKSKYKYKHKHKHKYMRESNLVRLWER